MYVGINIFILYYKISSIVSSTTHTFGKIQNTILYFSIIKQGIRVSNRAQLTFPQSTSRPLSFSFFFFFLNFSLKSYLKYLCTILNSLGAAANDVSRYLCSLCLHNVYNILLNFHMHKAVYHEGHYTKKNSKDQIDISNNKQRKCMRSNIRSHILLVFDALC